MKQSYDIVQATLQDLEEVAFVFNEYRMFYAQETDVQRARQFLTERLERRESIIFIAKTSSRTALAGFAQIYPVFSSISMQRSLILNDLYVKETDRGRGVGQLLLEAAKTYGKQQKAKELVLSTSINNTTAQRLYEKNGYVRDEEFTHYYLSL
ncbi:N-acetyltransferase [Paenibacillus sp. JX-17]|uniref:N-acetyltransferase n=1 Tax=Paenibacillus lacisoli TaxID=3064525 RepID=A0ABT9C6T5_9BACL|nr:N-acetyltransferase [Paenibacillus sp. JX-17]MDO7904968.1 N-acetyltransferase [Paenibacillus sp. JX-17]